MSYKNAAEILPTPLLEELQKYIEGAAIYVPKTSVKKGWGQKSGLRVELDQRNAMIRQDYQSPCSIEELAKRYHLSEGAIKKVLYGKKQF